jgi:hypothetical protein
MNGLDDFRPARTDLAIAVEIIGGVDAVRRAAVRELDVRIGFHEAVHSFMARRWSIRGNILRAAPR